MENVSLNALKERRRRSQVLYNVFGAVVAFALVTAVVVLFIDSSHLKTTAEQRGKQLEQVQTSLTDVCRKSELNEQQCYRVIKEFKKLPGLSGPVKSFGQKLTNEQIQGIVYQYLLRHPLPEGKLPTPKMVAAAVAEYMKRNPIPLVVPEDGINGTDGSDGQPGENASMDMVMAAVSSYCAPEDDSSESPCRGVKGDKGDPPTPEKVRTIVAQEVTSYCDANNGCRGADGRDGKDGEDGTDAVPFTFVFTVPGVAGTEIGERTYTCTVESPNTTVSCV